MNSKILSVIIPIYNVEAYLEEALDSVIQQDIGFEKNIQLILINDGSPDNSEAICLKYKEKYPSITYIKQKNGGVSSARNKGLDVATGKYIAFFDPDDVLSLDTYRLMVDFLEAHYDEIDMAAFKMKFFERFTGDHPLNYRFYKGSRVVDVRDNPTFMQSSGVSCVYKASALKNKRFDGSIKFAEDMKLINEVLLDKKKYGVVDGPIYYVRKRMDENSASNTGHLDPSYYMVTPVKVFKYLFDLWEKNSSHLDEFIQFVILFDLQFRINQPAQAALTADEEQMYRKNITDLVKRVTNDEIILRLPRLKMGYKLYLLKLKYGVKEFEKLLTIEDYSVYFNGIKLKGVRPGVGIDRIDSLGGGRLRIDGYVSGLITNKAKYWLETNSGKIKVKKNKYRAVSTRNIFLGEQVDINEAFSVEIDVDEKDEITFHYSIGGDDMALHAKTSYITGLGNLIGSYNVYGQRILERTKYALRVHQDSAGQRFIREVKFLYAIMSRLKLKIARREFRISLRKRIKQTDLSIKTKILCLVRPFFIPLKATTLNTISVALRLSGRLCNSLKRRRVWLISDKISGADDNGEALYRYLQKNDVKEKCFFAINKDSSDYERLKSQGFRVVNILSYRYKLLVLIADCIISSNADDLIFNPFLDSWDKYVDLMTAKFIFLQHGVAKDDLSRQYNRWNSKFDMFVTSTQQEYDSIVGSKYYGFTANEVKLTGLPRFDELKDTSKDKIVLIPTWRKGLDGGLDKKTGLRKYSPDFKNTEYFKFYNNVINDVKLKRVLEENNLTGEFYLHPSFTAQARDFSSTESFVVKTAPYDFKKIFSESRILITDYSSVAFDFAYLKKPVVYVQFDKENFFKSHTYKEGYYSYTNDGFGPVTTNRKDLVDAITKIVEQRCEMDKKYKQRVERAFKYTDRNNSKRVYEAIKSLT